MPRFFPGHKKPDRNKNFFQNYSDHLNYLQDKYAEAWEEFKNQATFDQKLDFIGEQALERLNLFEKLRDGHDYFDEVVGATALPALGLVISIATLGMALWEGIQALVIRTGIARGSIQEHQEGAKQDLLVSGVAFLGAIASFLKSAVSLITRPVITAIRGFEEQNIDRFITDDTYANRLANF
ncbi:hypothetical protein [Legionella maioricensis]|uniref:Uncharacterized protein n=1 Tax=Legionella maioricensis TaxID=2896528 RepID=A0A9X2D2J6_9GAMM|nr:hypothetical protein [Legionella maioricensis]MCL9685480.1 hypothetical protein [Legionella maioricensis]MCL9688812.1 hypothetical protein [Legionella maioricensis]